MTNAFIRYCLFDKLEKLNVSKTSLLEKIIRTELRTIIKWANGVPLTILKQT